MTQIKSMCCQSIEYVVNSLRIRSLLSVKKFINDTKGTATYINKFEFLLFFWMSELSELLC
jgi:hypothetical protein